MGEYAALLTLASLAAVLAGALLVLPVRVPPRRRRPPVSAPRAAGDAHRALVRFQIQAALFVAFGGLVLLLAAWVARADGLGRAGLGVAALVTAPLLVGFAHVIAQGGLGDDES